MMSNFTPQLADLLTPLLIGLLLGCGFFYALWFTVQKGLQSTLPAAWFLGGILARMATAVAVFYWVSANDMWRLIACLLGFIIGRLLMTKWLTRFQNSHNEKRELPHAH